MRKEDFWTVKSLMPDSVIKPQDEAPFRALSIYCCGADLRHANVREKDSLTGNFTILVGNGPKQIV